MPTISKRSNIVSLPSWVRAIETIKRINVECAKRRADARRNADIAALEHLRVYNDGKGIHDNVIRTLKSRLSARRAA
jgi:hypothetical protein